MTKIDSTEFVQICDEVWRDRAAILTRRGIVNGDTALLRAVYWRLCKAGGRSGISIEDYDTAHTRSTYHMVVISLLESCAHPRFDAAPVLEALVQRYNEEVRNQESPA